MKATLKKEISKLNLEELIELETEVKRLIQGKQKEAKADLKAKMIEMAKASGMTLDEVLGSGKSTDETSRKRKSPKPKYANPDDSAQIWSGRGRMPRWLADIADEQGVDLSNADSKADFLHDYLIEQPAE